MKLLVIGLLLSTNVAAFDFNFPTSAVFKPAEKQSELPDWVRQFENGAGVRINNGGFALFRNITKGTDGQRELCRQSNMDNRQTIKDMFPLIKEIPGIELRHVFFKKGMCATTISIKTKILNRLEEISLKQLEK